MIAPARSAAYDILRAVSTGRADLPSAVAEARRKLRDDRDRSLASEIATGVQRWRASLDHLIAAFSKRRLDRLDPEVVEILRLSAYQLLHLTHGHLAERRQVHVKSGIRIVRIAQQLHQLTHLHEPLQRRVILRGHLECLLKGGHRLVALALRRIHHTDAVPDGHAARGFLRRLLEEFGVEIGSHIVSLGGIQVPPVASLPVPLNPAADNSEIRVLDRTIEAEIIRRIDQAKKDGDTLGGEAQVVVRGLPVGLGSHVHWDRKLDGRLAGALMSIPAVKAVEIGMGFEAARRPGSEVHDPIDADAVPGTKAPDPALRGGYRRRSNNAGGLEGGVTTGEPLVIRVGMKPISTLMSPLPTVDLTTGKAANAQSERSDVTAVPAMGVIAEGLTALVVADAFLEKFGGDSLAEIRRNFAAYLQNLAARWGALSP